MVDKYLSILLVLMSDPFKVSDIFGLQGVRHFKNVGHLTHPLIQDVRHLVGV